MDFSSPATQTNSTQEEINYELLDYQLADLMLRLNGKPNQTLKDCVLEISKHTREGQIAYACTSEQQIELSKVKVVGEPRDYQPLILDSGTLDKSTSDKSTLYLRRYWQYQSELANQIKKRLKLVENNTEKQDWLNQRLDHYFVSGEVDSTEVTSTKAVNAEVDWQKEAARRALENNFLVLSGGPGTGKTTTITRIIILLIEHYNHLKKYTPPLSPVFLHNRINNNQPIRILLTAPTGKAAIRMVDAIRDTQHSLGLAENVLHLMPTEASTLHKLLGYIHGKVGFKYNRNNPLNADVVIVDEASMIDIALMSKLVEAVPAHAKLILVGDKDQLSSVETGSVFTDICKGLTKNQGNHIVTLQRNWRFSNDSGIGQLSIAANQGDSEKVVQILKADSHPECTLVSPIRIGSKLIPADLVEPWGNYFELLKKPQASISEIFAAFNQYRILCALRRGLNGSTIMSSRIETTLDQQGFIKLNKSNSKNWYHGRPVMISQNSYSKGLFNGDTGITLIKNGEAKVYFPDNTNNNYNNGNNNNAEDDGAEQGAYKSISPVRLPAHETTWAMTIHKSQGSEFDQVTLILPHEVMPLLTRQLIYTGVTRARKQLKVIASEDVLIAGVRTEVVQATRIDSLL